MIYWRNYFMHKLKKERLNQMINNALSYKQESKLFHSNSLYKCLKNFILKQHIYGVTFASLIIACLFIPPIAISRNFVDVNEINDYLTLGIIDDL